MNWHASLVQLAYVSGQCGANLRERYVDLVRKATHSDGCGKCDQRHDQGVLDQILPVVVHQDLDFCCSFSSWSFMIRLSSPV